MNVNHIDKIYELGGWQSPHVDHRGSFIEEYSMRTDFREFPHGIQQVSVSKSNAFVLRGLHFQVGMTKAIKVLSKTINLVMVDIRKNSPNYGNYTIKLRNSFQNALFIPSGIAIGFLTTVNDTKVQYYHSTTFNPNLSFTIAWDDPQLNITWPLDGEKPILSTKDAHGMSLTEWEHTFESSLFEMQY